MKAVSVQCFLKTAELLSITKASEELYLARQTVSRQIALLEQELGSPLFLREPTLKLTPEGEKYYNFFSYAREEYYRVLKITSERQRDKLSVIRFGCIFGIDLQPTIMDLLKRYVGIDNDELDMQWRYDDYTGLRASLLDGEINVAIANMREEEHHILGYDQAVFDTVQPMVVMHNNYYKKNMSSDFYKTAVCYLSLDDLAEGLDVENAFRAFWEGMTGVYLENLSVLPNRESVQNMVRQANGFSIATDNNELMHDDSIVAFPFGPPIDLVAIWRIEQHNKALQTFIDMLRQDSLN